MDYGINGKVALVAAASQGLGKGSAAALVRAGARVAILSRRPKELADAAKEIGAELALECDLSKADAIAGVIEETKNRLGPVSILVNNCGGPPGGTFDSITEEQWYASFEQVFMSALRLTRGVLPMMREGQWGRIVNIVSTSVQQPIPGLLISNAYRPALAGWAKTLSNEVAKDGILVNCVAPGRILTARADYFDKATAEKTGKSIEEIRAERSEPVPLKRYGQPEEFGEVVAFLCSQKASYLTGNVIRVDGGAVTSL